MEAGAYVHKSVRRYTNWSSICKTRTSEVEAEAYVYKGVRRYNDWDSICKARTPECDSDPDI